MDNVLTVCGVITIILVWVALCLGLVVLCGMLVQTGKEILEEIKDG